MKFICFLILVLSSIFIGCTSNKDSYVLLLPEKLSDDTLHDLKTKTLSGDIVSTVELMNAFISTEVDVTDDFMAWSEVAAENELFVSDPLYFFKVNCYNTAYYLLNITRNEERSLFWYAKSEYKGQVPEFEELADKYKNIFPVKESVLKNVDIENNLSAYRMYANLGSAEAARKLVLYYLAEKNDSEYTKWVRIGAQNGDKSCMEKYAQKLVESRNPWDSLRANFWYGVLSY